MKLHPLSVPFRVVEAALGLFWVLLFAGVAMAGTISGPRAIALLGVGIIAAFAVIVLWQIAYYKRFRYELTNDTFDIAHGVISRRIREIPYDRIQNVSINRNIVQRALGLAEVRIETAGGSDTEAHLRYVGVEEASRLQDEVSDRKRSVTPGTTEEEQTADLVFAIQPRELAVLGVVSFDLRIVFLLLFVVAPFMPTISEALGEGALFLLAVPILLVVLYILTAAVSAAFSVTNYYGFQLFQDREELRYERGLLQRFSGTIPLEKVQTISVSENVLARLVGYASLLVETAGFSPGQTGGSQTAVPIGKRERVVRLAHDIEPFGDVDFERPPKRARERYFVRYMLVLAGLALLTYAATIQWTLAVDWYLVVLALGFPIVPVGAHLKWKHRGYAVSDDYVITRNGFWNRTIAIVPVERIQTVVDSRTIFQRRRHLATLTIDTAGSRSLIADDSRAVDIDADEAARLREEITDHTLDALAETTDPLDTIGRGYERSGGQPST